MESSKHKGRQLIDHFSSTGGTPRPGELGDWINESPENHNDFQAYQKVWKGTEKLAAASTFQIDKAWSLVDRRIRQAQAFRRRMDRAVFSAVGMAASLILILGLAFYTGYFSIQPNKIQLATDYGSRTEVTLPDGSKIKLNSGSTLSYHFNSLTKVREVSFAGEGFFEVAKAQSPFVIHTPDGLDLKVLGTTFNLTAYPDEQIIKTALVEGKVELSNRLNEKLLLEPGQIGGFEKKSQSLDYLEDELSHVIGWTQNKMYLDNTSLREISIRLERWFNVRIQISPESLGDQIRYTGVLEEKTVQDVLDALGELSNIHYTIKGDKIIISK